MKREDLEILKLQQAVKEMIPLRDLSHNISSISYKNPGSLENFIKAVSKDNVNPKKSTLIYAYISSAVTVCSLIAYGTGLIPSVIPLGLFIYQFIAASFFSKKTNDEYAKINKATNAAKIYLAISDALKDKEFNSELLKYIKEEIYDRQNKRTAKNKQRV